MLEYYNNEALDLLENKIFKIITFYVSHLTFHITHYIFIKFCRRKRLNFIILLNNQKSILLYF